MLVKYLLCPPRQVVEEDGDSGFTSLTVAAKPEVVLSCWIPMAQWGSFKAQQKLHFKAVFHAVH